MENEWASTSKKNHKGPNTYEFRYDVENAPSNNIQYRMEERHPNGSVVGSYGQVQPNGNIKVVSYIADQGGIKTYVKDGGDDKYVAEGSNLDPVHRVTSQVIQTAVQSQQVPHRSPLYDKYHRPTPASPAAVAGQRVDSAHSYHQQRTNVDPASFRPVDSAGYQETHQPFIGDQLQDKLHTSNVQYQSVGPQQVVLQQQQQQQPPSLFVHNPVTPYSLQQPGVAPPSVTSTHPQQQQQPTHYVLNVPPLPPLADNSPLPLLPGQQPLPISPDRGPIMIQLQQPQQQQPQHLPPNPVQQQQQQPNYQYQPTQIHQQQVRLPPGPQQQYQQQPVRVQPPVHLQLQQQQLQQQQQQQQQQQHQQQQQQQQQARLAQQQYQPHQAAQQQQNNMPYQQSVMKQPYPQQVNIPARPSQIHVKGNVQQHQTVVPMQYFHQPNPATTAEQYRQQLQLQAAESHALPYFALPPRNFKF